MEKKDLLAELADLQGCKYLSDLKYRHNNRLYNCCLDLLNSKTEKFTLWEWEECVRYLMGEDVNVNSFDDVAEQLDRLRQSHDVALNTRERGEYDEE